MQQMSLSSQGIGVRYVVLMSKLIHKGLIKYFFDKRSLL